MLRKCSLWLSRAIPAAAVLVTGPAALAQSDPLAVRWPGAGDESGLAADGYPMAGWHSDTFYLRDRNDAYRLFVGGRAQLDAYAYAGAGVSASALASSVALRRLRPELSGDLWRRVFFTLAVDVGGAPQTAIAARPSDVFVGVHAPRGLDLQVGQFDVPFTLENRTSDAYTPFLERSLAVRTLGAPSNKAVGAMLSGDLLRGMIDYAGGVFLADGRTSFAAGGDALARLTARPFGPAFAPAKDVQLGVSLRTGGRDPSHVAYDLPSLTTQGGFAFWSPSYAGSRGGVHVLPAGPQDAVAVEIRVAALQLELTSELVWFRTGTREAPDGQLAVPNPPSPPSPRFGTLAGGAWYVQVGFWLLGDPNLVPRPGTEPRPTLDFATRDPAKPRVGLEVFLKGERLDATYQSVQRTPGGGPDPKNADGKIDACTFSAGANLWFTRHLRLTVNYVFDYFDQSAPSTPSFPGAPVQTSAQRAIAPAQTLSRGVDDAARNGAHALHEVLFRAALGL